MQTAVKERPILFSGEMVRAILADRKTQTRRIIKPQSERRPVPCSYVRSGWGLEGLPNDFGVKGCSCNEVACPFPDDVERLWVREAWRPEVCHSHGESGCCECDDVNVHYPADGSDVFFSGHDSIIPAAWEIPKAAKNGNVPSIHMPRWASRINLEITNVRAERLQDITPDDAIAEGVEEFAVEHKLSGYWTTSYARLWDQINGPGAWDLNPWVWVVEFNRVAL